MRKSLFGIYRPAHKASLLTLDVCAIALAFLISSELRLGLTPNYFSIEFLCLCLIIIVSLFIGNGYTSSTIGSLPRLPLKTFLVVFASSIPTTLFIYLLGPERFTYLFGRGIFPFAILIVGGLAMLNRLVLDYLFRPDKKTSSVLVVGDIQSRDLFNTDNRIALVSVQIEYSPCLAGIEDLTQYDAIVITPTHNPNKDEQNALILARLNGTPIFSLSDFFESFLFLVPVNEINNDWFIRAEGFTMLHSSVNVRLKRALDIIAALLLLVVTLSLIHI